jgi:CRISPR-associated protein (TIGR03984 family)
MTHQSIISEIKPTPLEVPALPNADALKQWIETQHIAYQLSYLIAHAEDGVIWGRFEAQQLVTADHLWKCVPKLQPNTLQQVRIFGKNAEVMLWHKDAGWQARVIQDVQQQADCVHEEQMIWGTQAEATEQGFTLLTDGQQGLRHAVPLSNVPCRSEDNKSLHRPVRLQVKHYIGVDNAGVCYIYLSRLVDLKTSH